MLTGKTEQQFKEWLYNNHRYFMISHEIYSLRFSRLPEVCQLALMQEFFESETNLSPYAAKYGENWASICEQTAFDKSPIYLEALKAAISKANDINNQKS